MYAILKKNSPSFAGGGELETCSGIVKRRSCRYLSALHSGDRVVLPRTSFVVGFSCTSSLLGYIEFLHTSGI